MSRTVSGALARAGATLLTGGLAAAAARAAYAALNARPPGGGQQWARTNHRGEPVTLLEGPARGPAHPRVLRTGDVVCVVLGDGVGEGVGAGLGASWLSTP